VNTSTRHLCEPPRPIGASMRAEGALTALQAAPAERQPYERGRGRGFGVSRNGLAVKRLEQEVARSLEGGRW
jgi:hypothetical protein